MKPHHLNCAVARATGESLQTIRQRGFQPLRMKLEPEPRLCDLAGAVIDWDELQAEQTVALFGNPRNRLRRCA